MSRKVLIVAVVVAVVLATVVVPAAANPPEAGSAASVLTEVWSGLSGGSLVHPLPIQLAGGGGCGGAGGCPT
jgi:type II secretory pathway component PulF